MYRLLVLALVMTLTVVFAGCGGTPDVPAPAEDEAVSPPAVETPAEPEAEGAEEESTDEAGADDFDWDDFEVVPGASSSAGAPQM